MTEPVRLVIWDLDDTFWRGTLTEGGVSFIPEHKEIVIELARRGIISSICSKNDFDPIKKILVEHEIWDFFVFPSISWEPKGPRIQTLIDAIGLRPPTVLFVDDNPSNLEEARHFVPGIQLADETVLTNLLCDPMFKGKDDKELTRLQQYKVLEKRNHEIVATADTTTFLRSSGIRVVIEHDIEAHIERAIELINRTNQLNFTKRRLPEDLRQAKDQLLSLISDYTVQAGLIRVYDRFGDYGYCGIYVERKAVHAGSGLLHYCFSCRTLGMMVETWLYRRLGRPPIAIAGEVISDIKDESQVIDWIQIEKPTALVQMTAAKLQPRMRVRVRGGCELMAVSHYLNLMTNDVVGEFAFNRDHIQIRIEHSLFLRYALEGLSQDAMTSLEKLGFRTEDFRTQLFDALRDDDVWILSFWGDSDYQVYRHKTLGIRIPFNAFPAVQNVSDFTKVEDHHIRDQYRNDWILDALRSLKDEYVLEGLLSESLFKENLEIILDRIPAAATVYILGSNEQFIKPDGTPTVVQQHVNLNKWCYDVASTFPNVTPLDLRQFFDGNSGVVSGTINHFDRGVYFRIYEEIAKRTGSKQSADLQPI